MKTRMILSSSSALYILCFSWLGLSSSSPLPHTEDGDYGYVAPEIESQCRNCDDTIVNPYFGKLTETCQNIIKDIPIHYSTTREYYPTSENYNSLLNSAKDWRENKCPDTNLPTIYLAHMMEVTMHVTQFKKQVSDNVSLFLQGKDRFSINKMLAFKNEEMNDGYINGTFHLTDMVLTLLQPFTKMKFHHGFLAVFFGLMQTLNKLNKTSLQKIVDSLSMAGKIAFLHYALGNKHSLQEIKSIGSAALCLDQKLFETMDQPNIIKHQLHITHLTSHLKARIFANGFSSLFNGILKQQNPAVPGQLLKELIGNSAGPLPRDDSDNELDSLRRVLKRRFAVGSLVWTDLLWYSNTLYDAPQEVLKMLNVDEPADRTAEGGKYLLYECYNNDGLRNKVFKNEEACKENPMSWINDWLAIDLNETAKDTMEELLKRLLKKLKNFERVDYYNDVHLLKALHAYDSDFDETKGKTSDHTKKLSLGLMVGPWKFTTRPIENSVAYFWTYYLNCLKREIQIEDPRRYWSFVSNKGIDVNYDTDTDDNCVDHETALANLRDSKITEKHKTTGVCCPCSKCLLMFKSQIDDINPVNIKNNHLQNKHEMSKMSSCFMFDAIIRAGGRTPNDKPSVLLQPDTLDIWLGTIVCNRSMEERWFQIIKYYLDCILGPWKTFAMYLKGALKVDEAPKRKLEPNQYSQLLDACIMEFYSIDLVTKQLERIKDIEEFATKNMILEILMEWLSLFTSRATPIISRFFERHSNVEQKKSIEQQHRLHVWVKVYNQRLVLDNQIKIWNHVTSRYRQMLKIYRPEHTKEKRFSDFDLYLITQGLHSMYTLCVEHLRNTKNYGKELDSSNGIGPGLAEKPQFVISKLASEIATEISQVHERLRLKMEPRYMLESARKWSQENESKNIMNYVMAEAHSIGAKERLETLDNICWTDAFNEALLKQNYVLKTDRVKIENQSQVIKAEHTAVVTQKEKNNSRSYGNKKKKKKKAPVKEAVDLKIEKEINAIPKAVIDNGDGKHLGAHGKKLLNNRKPGQMFQHKTLKFVIPSEEFEKLCDLWVPDNGQDDFLKPVMKMLGKFSDVKLSLDNTRGSHVKMTLGLPGSTNITLTDRKKPLRSSEIRAHGLEQARKLAMTPDYFDLVTPVALPESGIEIDSAHSHSH